ncbi:hypothetical protein [Sphingobacterium hotanense]|uniref:Uncharacterized protein n=1 Tax=Sphingobacterium hotanense TaxID=649196 RepID=A0ABT7NKK2_9SPHI|nr:hypothetical protein [Sphingobacterium hotanense]MDM1047713.1 hypothetical protein [Sphingobacterium hotanense]
MDPPIGMIRYLPLLWYNKEMKNETDFSVDKISDIAPTLSAILDIQAPSGNIGTVIKNVFK